MNLLLSYKTVKQYKRKLESQNSNFSLRFGANPFRELLRKFVKFNTDFYLFILLSLRTDLTNFGHLTAQTKK